MPFIYFQLYLRSLLDRRSKDSAIFEPGFSKPGFSKHKLFLFISFFISGFSSGLGNRPQTRISKFVTQKTARSTEFRLESIRPIAEPW